MITRNLPPQFAASPETVTVTDAVGAVVEILFDSKEDIMAQLNLDTATWGLALWEKEYGLECDLGKPYEHRRSRVRAKMRGRGTTTVAMLKNLSESFINGQVEVIEHKRQYLVTVKFISVYGIPPNLGDLTKSIQEVIPAHVAFDYDYTYFIWKATDERAITWGELGALGMDWGEFERGEWLNV